MPKFRASNAYLLLQSGRNKSDLFGKTAKSWFVELFVQEKYGRYKRDISNKFFEKGNKSEEDSITLLSKIDRKFYFKNEENFSNDYFTGTPDIITDTEIIDIKTPFDIFTFFAHKGEPLTDMYNVQLQIYMALRFKSKARLAYCLVNTPDEIAYKEMKWMDERQIERYSNLYDYSDIPEAERVYQVEVPFDPELYAKLCERAELANKWIKENLK